MKALALAYVGGVLTILLGAVTQRYLGPEAGVPLIAAGGALIGWIQRQPAFAAKEPPPPAV